MLSALGDGFTPTRERYGKQTGLQGGIASMMEVAAWTLLTLGMGQTLKESGILCVLGSIAIIIAKSRGI